MDVQETLDGVLIRVKVKPNARRFVLRGDGTLEVKSRPERAWRRHGLRPASG